jgi:hypothetical protein
VSAVATLALWLVGAMFPHPGPGHAPYQAGGVGAPACNDGIDNDGDGLIDYADGAGDLGCTNVTDTSEATGPLSAPDWSTDTANGRTMSTYSAPGTGGCPATVSAWVSGTPGSPTLYKWCDYTGQAIASAQHDITCYGCRFSSNVVDGANVQNDGDTIKFQYALFESSDDRSSPIATAADAYQYGVNYRCFAGASGMVIENSEMESFGNGIQADCPFVMTQSLLHDPSPEGDEGTDCPDQGDGDDVCFHNDGVLYNDGLDLTGAVFDFNRVVGLGNTNAMGFQYSSSNYSNLAITNSYFDGFGYTISMGDSAGHCPTACVFTGNTIATTYQPVWGWFRGQTTTWSNNKLEVVPNPAAWHIPSGGGGTIFADGDDGKFWCSNGTFSVTNCN